MIKGKKDQVYAIDTGFFSSEPLTYLEIEMEGKTHSSWKRFHLTIVQ